MGWSSVYSKEYAMPERRKDWLTGSDGEIEFERERENLRVTTGANS